VRLVFFVVLVLAALVGTAQRCDEVVTDVFVLGRMRGAQIDQLLGAVAKWSLGLGILGVSLSTSLYTVDGGERAVIFDRLAGVKQKVIGEGTHFRIPIVQTPVIYEVRTQAHEVSSHTGSRDLQTVEVSLRLLYRPDIDSLPKIYSSFGVDYDQRVLPSLGNEVLKSVVAQYDAGELITQREVVSRKVREGLVVRAADFGIVLEDVAITHLAFSHEYTIAIESKQVAQQDAERSKFLVMKVRSRCCGFLFSFFSLFLR
jgi:prohibitin 1